MKVWVFLKKKELDPFLFSAQIIYLISNNLGVL